MGRRMSTTTTTTTTNANPITNRTMTSMTNIDDELARVAGADASRAQASDAEASGAAASGAAAPPTRAGATAADLIELSLDGRPHRVPGDTTLAELVSQLGYGPTEVGTAVNGAFVARGERAGRALRSGDAVLLFQPIVGG